MLEGIKLVRIDFRLIHGQVITKWSNIIHTTRIVVVNDELANDEFMSDIYTMAAPPGVEVEVVEKKAFVEAAKNESYDEGNILVLFKNIADAAAVVDAGIAFSQVQIGGLGSGNGRTMVVKGISIDSEDADQLGKIEAAGAEVTFQVTPEEQKLTLAQAKNKL